MPVYFVYRNGKYFGKQRVPISYRKAEATGKQCFPALLLQSTLVSFFIGQSLERQQPEKSDAFLDTVILSKN